MTPKNPMPCADVRSAFEAWFNDRYPIMVSATGGGAIRLKEDLLECWQEAHNANPVGEWLPIESAPHGETVLLWVPNAYGHKHVKTGIYKPPAYPHFIVVSIYDDGERLGYYPEGYATHWMPLPAPPITAAKMEGE